MAAVRLAIYPSPATDGPSMALLFFFAIACFWLGTVQSTGFWAEERVLFNRECRQGTSSFAFIASALVSLFLVVALQCLIATVTLKYLSWTALLQGTFSELGSDLLVGPGRLYFWAGWAALNGVINGLFWSTIQYRFRPQLTGPATAQMLALFITLTAIVFSFPIIGERAYQDATQDPFNPDRFHVLADVTRIWSNPELPGTAMLLAEAPIAANPSFQGLWFQAERPLRTQAPPARFSDMQKEGVPSALANAILLVLLGGTVFLLAHRLKGRPVPR